LSSGNAEDNKAAVEFVKEKAGRLDVVIANAGMGRSIESLAAESTDEMRAHWDVNVGGPHVLFKAVYSLLCQESPRGASDPPPKFVTISSIGASIEIGTAFNFIAYGASKVAVNYMMRKIHFEHEKDGIVAFPLCPGAVDTNMWTVVKEKFKTMTVSSPDESAKDLMRVIDGATRESCSGKFMNHKGEILPW